MEYRVSRHAEDELIIRDISRAQLESVMQAPDQIIDGGRGTRVFQAILRGTPFLLRVVVSFRVEPPLVITLYRTTKIQRYWKP